MAEAAAIGFTRRNFPRAFPIRRWRIMAESMVGLRDYSKLLHHAFPENSVDDYNTNPFWVHLADFYHSGRFKFLYDYSARFSRLTGDQRSEAVEVEAADDIE